MSQIKYYLKRITPPVFQDWHTTYNLNRKYKKASKFLKNADKLHLACGTNVINNWHNVDLFESPEVIYWDLTDKRFPVEDNTINLIFCEHFIEHIDLNQGYIFLKNCFNALKKSGSIRISTPDLNKIIQCYLQKNLTEWSDVGFIAQSPCRLLDDSVRLWGHQFIYDEDELTDLMSRVGFKNIRRMQWHKSEIKEFNGLECRPYHNDLILEADK